MSTPPWWTPDFPELVAGREPMPSVERWQTSYVRFHRHATAQVCHHGWELGPCLRNYEQIMRVEHQRLLPDDHVLLSGFAPENITMKIVEAPAEFAVPVKQDRRLCPHFRVRVEVKHQNKISLPFTVKAYIISQQEKDSILSWYPDEIDGDNLHKKSITDLKGTTSITHLFEASAPAFKSDSVMANTSLTFQNSFGVQPQHPLESNEQRLQAVERANFFSDSLPALDVNLGYGHSNTGLHQNMSGVNLHAGLKGLSLSSQYPSLNVSNPQSSFGVSNLPRNHNLLMSLWNNETDLKIVEQIFNVPQKNGNIDSAAPPPYSIPSNVLSNMPPHSNNFQASSISNSDQARQTSTLVQDFEFANLEFVRPSRMNKVYLVFACVIADMDLLFSVYNVPTVCICRAEQRAKACKKLNISHVDLGTMEHASGPSASMHVPDAHTARKRENEKPTDSSESDGNFQPRKQLDVLGPVAEISSGSNRRSTPMDARSSPATRTCQALWRYINEEYESTGLTRRLTELDIQALSSQAGFPAGSMNDNAVISQVQWDEFVSQYKNMLSLLTQIASVWNLEDPCVVSGFDMDRMRTVTALAAEPVGTFICRFSMSQPGCLVISCKVSPTNMQADPSGLIHAIIKVDDLNERRVDTWIRDFAGATHVLDVYRQKRVDKRKVFASNYMRIKGLEVEAPQVGARETRDAAPMS